MHLHTGGGITGSGTDDPQYFLLLTENSVPDTGVTPTVSYDDNASGSKIKSRMEVYGYWTPVRMSIPVRIPKPIRIVMVNMTYDPFFFVFFIKLFFLVAVFCILIPLHMTR